MMNRPVIESLDDHLVFVCDGGVADVDQAIGGAGEKDGWSCRVEVEL